MENLFADAGQLRKQHVNLLRRRENFAQFCFPSRLTEMGKEDEDALLSIFYQNHRQDFEKSEAQVDNRKHDEEVAGQFIYANILLSVF